MARSFKIYSSALHLVELQTRPLLQLSNQTVLIVGQDVPEWPPFVLMAAIISFLSLLMEELQRSCIHHLLQLYQPAKKKRDQFYGIKKMFIIDVAKITVQWVHSQKKKIQQTKVEKFQNFHKLPYDFFQFTYLFSNFVFFKKWNNFFRHFMVTFYQNTWSLTFMIFSVHYHIIQHSALKKEQDENV